MFQELQNANKNATQDHHLSVNHGQESSYNTVMDDTTVHSG